MYAFGVFYLVVKIANSIFMNWHDPMGLRLLFQQFGNRMVYLKESPVGDSEDLWPLLIRKRDPGCLLQSILSTTLLSGIGFPGKMPKSLLILSSWWAKWVIQLERLCVIKPGL